tara:strand:- start:284 stop:658 length:375 start_codon:yes stop_codon:yes gene_type:complete
MKKLIIILAIFFYSCALKKAIDKDPFIGTYNMTVLEVENYGDIPLFLKILKDGSGYKSEIKPQNQTNGSDGDFKIYSTKKKVDVFEIEANADGYDINFILKINEDNINGTMFDTFEVIGKKIKN